MTKNQCPLGEDCDLKLVCSCSLTTAWMAGAEKAQDQIKAQAAEIERLRAKLAKAVDALHEAWFMLTVPMLNYQPEPEEPGLRRIKDTLAELTGDKT